MSRFLELSRGTRPNPRTSSYRKVTVTSAESASIWDGRPIPYVWHARTMAPSVPTLKMLFALSRNICAFADPVIGRACEEQLADASWEGVKAEVCHIRGRRPGSARYDPSYRSVDAFENLVLFCPNHHTQVDSLEPVRFTVELLVDMKTKHESRADAAKSWTDDSALEQFAIKLQGMMAATWAAQDARARFEVEEMKQILAGAINRLGDREKIVLSLYYYENLTLAQIGEVLGVTESQVSQIHSKAVVQLGDQLTVADRNLDIAALLEQIAQEPPPD